MIDNIEPGTKVAVISSDGSRDRRVTFTAVDRLTKTLIVTTNGERFRRSDQKQPPASAWTMSPYLADPESEQVQRIYRDQRIRGLRGRIVSELNHFPPPTDADGQAEVARRVAEWARSLAEITTGVRALNGS